nr:zinc finger, CCHC-type [Tanacetum cinerariifolium]
MTSSITRFDIEKFDGKNDFGLWQIKMRDLMVHLGCDAALEALPADIEAGEKDALMKKAYNTLILCLGDRVLREVTKETTAAGIWTKLTSLYMTKSLANRLESLIMEDVLATLNSRELKKRTKGTKEEASDGLYIKGRSDHLGKAHSGGSLRFKYRGGTGKLKYFICHSEGHLKRDCPKKKSSGFVKKSKGDQDSDSFDDEDNAYFGEDLVAVGNDEMTELGAQGDRESKVFQVSNDDAALAQRRLEDKQLEEKTNTNCLVKEQEKVHLGIKVRANIMVIGVPGQEGADGNVAKKKKVKESMETNLGKLLKYNDWSTRWSRFEVPTQGKDVEYRLCLSVTPKVKIVEH